MQQDLSAFVRRLTLLRNELLQEKERNKRTQHRIKTLKQSHDQKSLQWKDLLSKEEAVKTQYVETQRATDQEKSRMKKVKEKITVLRGVERKFRSAANTGKHDMESSQIRFDTMYTRQLRLENIAKELAHALRASQWENAKDIKATKKKKSTIERYETIMHDVERNVAGVKEILQASIAADK
jgi:hypothetical protein|eukprot:Stramenopile-MAST_4_protein_279